MNKLVGIFAILSIAIAASMLLTPLVTAMPVIKRPADFIEATIEGGSPQTVDYSYAYDTASAEILFNTMDTLIMFNAEHDDSFIPSIATSWSSTPLGPGGTGIDSGIPIAGLNFESPANQTGPNARYYYRYDFKIYGAVGGVTPILFHDYPAGYTGPAYSRNMTLDDICYSFQRTMVQDRYAGPQWMLQEPLLDQAAGDVKPLLGGIADFSVPSQVNELGRLIENSVRHDNTTVSFYLMFPGAYAPLYQIIAQTWSSITSKAWTNDYVIGQLGRNDWSGDWSAVHAGYVLDHTGWIDAHLTGRATISPLDSPFPVSYGSGPFILTAGTPDYVNNFWGITRFHDYFRGWTDNPATGYGGDFPKMAGAQPAGYVETVEVTWNYVWGTRKTMFLAGDCDFCAIPDPSFYGEMYKLADPSGTPLDGLRVIRPLTELVGDACFFTFSISESTVSGAIGNPGTFNVNNIPPDFFGNATWGIYVRKAFAQAFDYSNYLATVFLGEATRPATAIIPGITYYDPTVAGWVYNLNNANASFNLAGPDVNGKMLKNVGFTITIAYNTGNTARQKAAELLKTAIESLNPLYHVNVIGVDWSPYLTAAETQSIPCFIIGWLVDFPDAHDWALPFYASYGSFGGWQGYSNPTMDALVNLGISQPDGAARQATYTAIQNLAMSDCPSFMLDAPQGRHFEKDWVVGYYYSPIYPGAYYYNRWKWYYVPLSSGSTAVQPFSNDLPFDVNYDGVIDMKDIGTAAASFLATYVDAPTTVPLWVFRGDVNNDRSIDMFDIGSIAAHFLETGPTWAPGGFSVSLTPLSASVAKGNSTTFTAVVSGGTAPYTYVWYQDNAPTGVTTSTYVFTSPGDGDYNVTVVASDSASHTATSPAGTIHTEAFSVSIAASRTTVHVDGSTYFSSHSAQLTVTGVGGSTPYTYQWWGNVTGLDAAIAGETGASYIFTPAAGPMHVHFYCVVSDAATPTEQVTSSSILINVLNP